MKFEVKWTAYNQNVEVTEVEAINSIAADDKVRSMYGNLRNYRSLGVSRVYEDINTSYGYSNRGNSNDDTDFAAGLIVAGIGIFIICGISGNILLSLFGLGMVIYAWKSSS